MKYLTTLLLSASLLSMFSCTKTETKTETSRTVKQYDIAQFMDTESVSGGSFSYDNSKILFSSNKTGIRNVYSMPSKGGEITPITSSDSTSFRSIAYFPEDNRILVTADNNGDELYHLFVREENGSIKDISPDKGSRVSFYGWSKDKKNLYYLSNKRDAKFFDVYKMNLTTYQSSVIYENNTGLSFADMSDDERYFALSKSINTNDSDLFMYDTQTKETIKVNERPSSNSAQYFSLDSSTFYYTTDDNEEFSYVMSYDIATKEKKKVYGTTWDVSSFRISPKGNYWIISSNEDGKSVTRLLDANTLKEIPLDAFSNQNVTGLGFNEEESLLRMYAGPVSAPNNLYSYDFKNGKKYQLSDVLNPEIQAEDLVPSTVVRYPSFDGTTIPAIYYKPHQASAENKVPALVWVHGGPGGQSRQGYSSLIQYLVNHGYAVLAVNNRGSSGYGKTFYQMDDLNHGENDLQDCVEGKNWLQKQTDIDPDKIGIIGGSYGGYMTMAALTYTPEEFKVGVNIFGVTNWIRTLKSIPPYWESYRNSLYKEIGDPFSADSVRLKKISPLFHTEKVTKPLMVLQGAQDPRVLKVESDEIVAGVRKNGVPVEYVLFEDEGHGFVKKENQIKAYSGILDFLEKHLNVNVEKEKL